jgi:hypothetical protein
MQWYIAAGNSRGCTGFSSGAAGCGRTAIQHRAAQDCVLALQAGVLQSEREMPSFTVERDIEGDLLPTGEVATAGLNARLNVGQPQGAHQADDFGELPGWNPEFLRFQVSVPTIGAGGDGCPSGILVQGIVGVHCHPSHADQGANVMHGPLGRGEQQVESEMIHELPSLAERGSSPGGDAVSC